MVQMDGATRDSVSVRLAMLAIIATISVNRASGAIIVAKNATVARIRLAITLRASVSVAPGTQGPVARSSVPRARGDMAVPVCASVTGPIRNRVIPSMVSACAKTVLLAMDALNSVQRANGDRDASTSVGAVATHAIASRASASVRPVQWAPIATRHVDAITTGQTVATCARVRMAASAIASRASVAVSNITRGRCVRRT